MKSKIQDALTETEQLLIVEALHRLRETKQGALKTVRAEGLMAGGRGFEERDFSIPQIDRLLEKLDD